MSALLVLPFLFAFFLQEATAQSACPSFEFEPLSCTKIEGCCYLSENLQPRPAPNAQPSGKWESDLMCVSDQEYRTARAQARGLSVEGFLKTINSNETDITLESLCRVEKAYIDTNTQTIIDPFFCQCSGYPIGLGNYSTLGSTYQSACREYDTGSPGTRCFDENADCYFIQGQDSTGKEIKSCSSMQALAFEILQKDPSKSLEENLQALGISGIKAIVDTNLCQIYSLLPAALKAGELTNLTCWTSDPSTSNSFMRGGD